VREIRGMMYVAENFIVVIPERLVRVGLEGGGLKVVELPDSEKAPP